MADGTLVEIKFDTLGIAKRDKLIDAGNTTRPISQNEFGEYNIHDLNIEKNGKTLFTAHGEDIAEIYNSNDQLFIKILTDKQVNIFSDIQAKSCRITSKGPVCISGKCEVEEVMQLAAYSACLTKPLQCKSAEFKLGIGVVLDAPLSCDHIHIEAPYVLQKADLRVKNQLDIITQAFQQTTQAKTITSQTRLLADQCEIAGEFLSKTQTFIAANVLALGHTKNPSTIHLLGTHYIHSATCFLKGDTQVSLDHQDPNSAGQFIVDNSLLIEKGVLLEIKNSIVDAETINNKGDLYNTNSIFKTDRLIHEGCLDSDGTELEIYDHYLQEGDSYTVLKKSLITTKELITKQGQFSLSSSSLQTAQANFFGGAVLLSHDSELSSSGNCLFFKESKFSIDQSRLNVSQLLNLDGETDAQHAQFRVGSLEANKGPLKFNHSTIDAEYKANLDTPFTFNDVRLHGNEVSLKGNLAIHNSYFTSKKLSFDSKKGTVNKSSSYTDYLVLNGGEGSLTLEFNDSQLTSHLFLESGLINLNNSLLIGTHQKNTSHLVKGKIHLNNSRIISPDQIHATGDLKATHSSMLQTSTLWNEAAIETQQSSLNMNNLLHSGKMTAQASQISVKEAVVTKNSQMQLDDKTHVHMQDFYHHGHLKLSGKSTLIVENTLSSHSESNVIADESMTSVKQLFTFGNFDLRKTLLSTEELHIYNQFASVEGQVLAKKQLSILDEADASFKDAMIATQTIDVFGHLSCQNGIVMSTEMNGWTTSQTTLREAVQVQTQNLSLLGTLVTASKTETAEENKTQAIPRLNVEERMMITSTANVKGDNLVAEVKEADNVGKIALTGELQARGNTFNNIGDLSVESRLFLGFDNYVLNTGSISSRHIVVHSNFMNILGSVFASQSFSCSGFLNANLGFIAANNYSNNSALSLNMGLALPNFSANLEDIFSFQNLTSFAQISLTSLFPSYSRLINMGFMLPSLYDTAQGLVYKMDEIQERGLFSFRNHELMPLFCQIKGAAQLGMNAYDSISQNTPSVDSRSFGKQMFDILAGSYSDNSIISLNTGITLATNTTKSNFIDLNSGIQYSQFNHMINTHLLMNGGYSSGNLATFETKAIYNSGTLVGRKFLNLKTGTLRNNSLGRIVAQTASNIECADLHQTGTLQLQNGQLTYIQFTTSIDANTELSNIAVNGNREVADHRASSEHHQDQLRYETEVKALDSQIEAATENHAQLKRQEAVQTETYLNAITELASAQTELSRLEATQQQIDQENRALDLEIQQNQQEKASQQAVIDSLQSQKGGIERKIKKALRNPLGAVKDSSKEVNKQLNAACTQVDDLAVKIDRARLRLAQNSTRTVKNEIERAREKVNQCQQSITTATESLEEIRKASALIFEQTLKPLQAAKKEVQRLVKKSVREAEKQITAAKEEIQRGLEGAQKEINKSLSAIQSTPGTIVDTIDHGLKQVNKITQPVQKKMSKQILKTGNDIYREGKKELKDAHREAKKAAKDINSARKQVIKAYEKALLDLKNTASDELHRAFKELSKQGNIVDLTHLAALGINPMAKIIDLREVSIKSIKKAFNRAGHDISAEWKRLPPGVRTAIIVVAVAVAAYFAIAAFVAYGGSFSIIVSTSAGPINVLTYSAAGVQIAPALVATAAGFGAYQQSQKEKEDFEKYRNSPYKEYRQERQTPSQSQPNTNQNKTQPQPNLPIKQNSPAPNLPQEKAPAPAPLPADSKKNRTFESPSFDDEYIGLSEDLLAPFPPEDIPKKPTFNSTPKPQPKKVVNKPYEFTPPKYLPSDPEQEKKDSQKRPSSGNVLDAGSFDQEPHLNIVTRDANNTISSRDRFFKPNPPPLPRHNLTGTLIDIVSLINDWAVFTDKAPSAIKEVMIENMITRYGGCEQPVLHEPGNDPNRICAYEKALEAKRLAELKGPEYALKVNAWLEKLRLHTRPQPPSEQPFINQSIK